MRIKEKENVVVLHDSSVMFKQVGNDLKKLIKDKTVVEYPSGQGRQKDIANIKDFIEMNDHILVTESRYFNGCEAFNIILLNYFGEGVRNSLMRGVKHVICVQVSNNVAFYGMKEDKRFY